MIRRKKRPSSIPLSIILFANTKKWRIRNTSEVCKDPRILLQGMGSGLLVYDQSRAGREGKIFQGKRAGGLADSRKLKPIIFFIPQPLPIPCFRLSHSHQQMCAIFQDLLLVRCLFQTLKTELTLHSETKELLLKCKKKLNTCILDMPKSGWPNVLKTDSGDFAERCMSTG